MLLKIGQRPDHGFEEPLGLLSDCHRRIEQFLATLRTIAAARRGARLTAAEQAQLETAAIYFSVAAPRHTADEEESLFPRLRASAHREAVMAWRVLERLAHDHTVADGHHRIVDGLVWKWLAAGTLDAPDAEELCRRLDALTAIYAAHIAIEDGHLFPLAARILPDDDVRAVGREMAMRRQRRTRS